MFATNRWARRRAFVVAGVMVATLLGTAPIGAATTTDACGEAASRAFDFWLGDWQVHKPDGTLAGRNRITREYDGCVIHEHYTTPHGYSGESLNSYDRARGVWHQTWVDNRGLVLLLEGGMRDGAMILQGQTLEDGRSVQQRITWTPNADGSVRQLWESTDANGQWTTAFDGKYTKR